MKGRNSRPGSGRTVEVVDGPHFLNDETFRWITETGHGPGHQARRRVLDCAAFEVTELASRLPGFRARRTQTTPATSAGRP